MGKGHTHATMHVWKSKASLWELVLCFHHVGSRAQTQLIRLVSKSLYQLTPIPSPDSSYFMSPSVMIHLTVVNSIGLKKAWETVKLSLGVCDSSVTAFPETSDA